MKGTQVIKQHYVSKFILKNFANHKEQVFESLIGESKVYQTNINQSMCKKLTYEHSELEQNSLETTFSEIEGSIAPKFKLLIQLLDSEESEIVEIKKIVLDIIYEVIIFYYRSGAVLHEMSFQKENKDQQLMNLLRHISNSEYIYSLSKTIVDNYNFAIIRSANNEFLLSDQYISTASLNVKTRFANISNRHIGLKNVIILIPLSSKYYIVFFDGSVPNDIQKERINNISTDTLFLLNRAIINNSYHKSVAQVENVLKERLADFKYHSPAKTILSYASGLHKSFTLKKEVFLYDDDEKAYELFANLEYQKFMYVGRNDTCPCGSDLKFKKCCLSVYEKVDKIKNDMQMQVNPTTYMINSKYVAEKSIDELISFEEPELLKQVKEATTKTE
ncbi:DUF4238 domain-containing protein [Alkalibacillus haloalkaliphilus]|uniref:DUF4238 domain-containing protein n=1 Tax=Alkalibacillus haloalkaliphilus TaxID=94136 RepID=A0A511W6K8_9BACI|nr:DUF4238 domain-containing protein [Alkalibacillus haloalkaliphilus]GEN46730.1 hypothetical protein AHA02nite_25060 [Alkalibacillus haloalkaliphilus]